MDAGSRTRMQNNTAITISHINALLFQNTEKPLVSMVPARFLEAVSLYFHNATLTARLLHGPRLLD